MARADFSTPAPMRLGIVVVVILIHVGVMIGLIRAFAPGVTTQIVETVTSAFTVTVPPEPPEPTPTPIPTPEPSAISTQEEGAAAQAGKKAKPKEITAPKAKIVIAERPAPKVASKGNDVSSGAADKGEGTGAGGEGQGTGSGGRGDGQGGGAVTQPVKIAGEINSARDYPRESRELRIDDQVVVVLTVGIDGRVTNCRVHRPSRDPEADRITCRLATARFRFKPATDAAGKPVVSTFGWQQRWFYKDKKRP